MKKLILLTALTTALFADNCVNYMNLSSKESQKVIEYFNNGMYDMACYQIDTVMIYAVNAKVECSYYENSVKSIDKLIESIKGFKKEKCK